MTDTATETETLTDLKIPSLWNVKILNDDFSPIEFVIGILVMVFKKSEPEALDMTLKVHEQGSAVAGTYTKDIAFTKIERALKLAESNGHPLRLVPEPSA